MMKRNCQIARNNHEQTTHKKANVGSVGGNLPNEVSAIISIINSQNQILNKPLLCAGATFGLLSINGKKKKAACAIPNAIKPASYPNGRKISYDQKKYHSG